MDSYVIREHRYADWPRNAYILLSCSYLDRASLCKSATTSHAAHNLLLNAASLKRLSSGGEARNLPRTLVTSTSTETASLSKLAKNYKALRAAAHVEFNAVLALKHASVSNVEEFDSVIHLVSHPLASIEALSRLSRVDLDELLPQPFAAANQTALHHAMVHWLPSIRFWRCLPTRACASRILVVMTCLRLHPCC
jgi:hypothetical protein